MRRTAFSIVELIAVIAILAILAGIGTSKFIDVRDRARQSSEAGAVGAVRSAIRNYMTNSALTGSYAAPSTLDAAAAGATSTGDAPFFGTVLQGGVTSGWTKTAANTYVGPTGTTYIYDPPTGVFGDAATIAAATASLPPTSPSLQLTGATQWVAGAPSSPTLGNGQIVGSGYTLGADGVLELTDAQGFSEAARRTAIVGQAIMAGSFNLALDTRLTNYWNQLNYWQVYAVAAGSTFNLAGNALNWGTAPAGSRLLAQNYAPELMSDGNWYSYNTAFTVSAADAAQYSQIVVVMAGTKYAGQTLSWRNFAITPN